jgi:hypothetical protein
MPYKFKAAIQSKSYFKKFQSNRISQELTITVAWHIKYLALLHINNYFLIE